MRFDFTIHADDNAELRDALLGVAQAIPESVFNKPGRTFKIEVSGTLPPAPHTPLPVVTLDPDLPTAQGRLDPKPAPTDLPPAPASAKRGRKANKSDAADPTPTPTPTPPVSPVQDERDDGDAEGDTEGRDDETQADPEDPDEIDVPAKPTLAPAEARLKALDLLRQAFAHPDGPAHVRAVQTAFGVKKFGDVPDSEGPRLLVAAQNALDDLSKGVTPGTPNQDEALV